MKSVTKLKMRTALITALTTRANPFDRHADATHITASAIVTSARGTHLHLPLREHKWLQPGGHIDDGELPYETALRETMEETGINVSHYGGFPYLLSMDNHTTSSKHTHLDLCYLLAADDSNLNPRAGESQDVRWFSWNDAFDVTREDTYLHASLLVAHSILIEDQASSSTKALPEAHSYGSRDVQPGYEQTYTKPEPWGKDPWTDDD